MRGKPSFGHIPSIEQGKRDVFITVVNTFLQFFYGLSAIC
jgi:hypothetical protein